MTDFDEHHLIAAMTCCDAALDILETQSEMDIICELKNIFNAQSDILDCLLQNRHYGSNSLDSIISNCIKIIDHIKNLEENS